MNDIEISKKIGKNRNWLYLIKKRDIKDYNYIFTFDENRFQSVLKYLEYQRELKNKMATLYFYLKDNRKLLYFSREVSKIKIYKNTASAINTISKSGFDGLDKKYNYKTMKRYEKILELANMLFNINYPKDGYE